MIKTAAASQILDGIKKLELRCQLAKNAQQMENDDEQKKSEPVRLYATIFSFEELHQLMLENDSKALGFFY